MAFLNTVWEEYLTKSTVQVSSLEADSHRADQEIPHLSWNTEVCHIPKAQN